MPWAITLVLNVALSFATALAYQDSRVQRGELDQAGTPVEGWYKEKACAGCLTGWRYR